FLVKLFSPILYFNFITCEFIFFLSLAIVFSVFFHAIIISNFLNSLALGTGLASNKGYNNVQAHLDCYSSVAYSNKSVLKSW
ncbi:MAG: hypothetical protein QM493_03935, partial [Sulfurovum sp.]